MSVSIVILGVDLGLIHWLHVFYALFAIAVTAGGAAKLYPMGMGRAVIFGIGAVLVFTFFGYRWFGGPVQKSKMWPPTINMCPDFLTFVPKVTGTTSVSGGGCVDLLGITVKDAGLTITKKSELSTVSASDTSRLFEFTAADIKASKDDPVVVQVVRTVRLTDPIFVLMLFFL